MPAEEVLRSWPQMADRERRPLSDRPEVKHPFYLQTSHEQSKSRRQKFDPWRVDQHAFPKLTAGLYTFDLLAKENRREAPATPSAPRTSSRWV